MIFRFAIDGSADFSSADSHIQSLASAPPDVKSRLSTTISVKTQPLPVINGDKGDKDKRRRSDGMAQGKKHKKTKA
jgi:N-acetyltransferase 10